MEFLLNENKNNYRSRPNITLSQIGITDFRFQKISSQQAFCFGYAWQAHISLETRLTGKNTFKGRNSYGVFYSMKTKTITVVAPI